MRSAVPSWSVRSTPERAVRVRALAGNIVLCSWARHITLTVPLSTQVYKWVPANCWGTLTKLRRSDLRPTNIQSRWSRNTSTTLHATETGICSGSYGPGLAHKASLFYIYEIPGGGKMRDLGRRLCLQAPTPQSSTRSSSVTSLSAGSFLTLGRRLPLDNGCMSPFQGTRWALESSATSNWSDHSF